MPQIISELAVRISADIQNALSGIRQVETGLSTLARNAGQAATPLATLTGHVQQLGAKLDVASTSIRNAALPLAGLSAGLGLLARDALSTSIEYEKAMNVLQAVTSASAEEMQRAAARAKELGADMSLPATSAADAAKAITELAKGGLDLEASLAAAKGALQLAAAGEIEAAEAARAMAGALNAFKLPAESATMIANRFAAAANASALEVKDMTDALKMSAAVWNAFQGPVRGAEGAFNDLTTAIALLGNAGIRGSDAGTSLKQALLQLTGPSQHAKDAMQALYIAALNSTVSMENLDKALSGTAKERFEALKGLAEEAGVSLQGLGDIAYDAAGNMRPFREIIELVAAGTANMTDELRNMALTTIFGADATRAITILLQEGAEGWDRMADALARADAAQELSAARMRGLGGALEGLQSQIETVWVTIGEIVSPVLEDVVRAVADVVGAFGELPAPVLAAVAAFSGVLLVAGPLALAVAALGPVLIALTGPLGLVVLGVGALVAALAAAKVAWDTDWAGLRTTVEREGLGGLVQRLWDLRGRVVLVFRDLTGAVLRTLFDAFTGPFRRLIQFVAEQFRNLLGAVRQALGVVPGASAAFDVAEQFLEQFMRGLEAGKDAVAREFQDTFVPALEQVGGFLFNLGAEQAEGTVEAFNNALERSASDVADAAEQGIADPLTQVLRTLPSSSIRGVLEMIHQTTTTLEQQAATVRAAYEDAIVAPLAQVVEVAGASGTEVGQAVTTGVVGGVTSAVDTVAGALNGLVTALPEAVVPVAQDVGVALGDAVTTSMADEVVAQSQVVADSVVTLLTAVQEADAEAATETGQFTGGALVQGMTVSLAPETATQPLITQLMATLAQTRDQAVPTVQATGQLMGGALVQGMTDMLMPQVPTITSTFASMMTFAATAMAQAATEAGTSVGTSFVSAVAAAVAGGTAYVGGGIAGLSAVLAAGGEGTQRPGGRPGGGVTLVGGGRPPPEAVPGYTIPTEWKQVVGTYSATGYQQASGAVSTVATLAVPFGTQITKGYTSFIELPLEQQLETARARAEWEKFLEEVARADAEGRPLAFASGGPVPGPRDQARRAIVHGGEVVLPADLADALRRVLVAGGPVSISPGSAGRGGYTRVGGGPEREPPVVYNVSVSGVGMTEVAREVIRRLDARERLNRWPTSAGV